MEQVDDLAVGGDDVGAVVLTGHRGLAQLGVQRIGVGAVGGVEDLREEARLCGGDHDVDLLQARGRGMRALPAAASGDFRATRRSAGSCPVTNTVASWVGIGWLGKPAASRCRSAGWSTVR